eukprot:2550491-Heterocapsa_arctica.AAC.1
MLSTRSLSSSRNRLTVTTPRGSQPPRPSRHRSPRSSTSADPQGLLVSWMPMVVMTSSDSMRVRSASIAVPTQI